MHAWSFGYQLRENAVHKIRFQFLLIQENLHIGPFKFHSPVANSLFHFIYIFRKQQIIFFLTMRTLS